MKKTIWAIIFLLTIGIVSAVGTNLLVNGDFSGGTSNWGLINNSAVTFSTTEGVGVVSVTNPGNTYLQNTGQFTLEAGKTYSVTFDAWSTDGRDAKVFVYKAGSATRYTPVAVNFNLTDEDWQTFTFEFVPTINGTVTDALLAFDLRDDVAGMTYFFDNVEVVDLSEPAEVPEFGVVAAGIAMVGAIAGFVFLKRRH